MWPHPWNNNPFPGCHQCPNMGAPLGQHLGAPQCGHPQCGSPQYGGCGPPMHAMGPQGVQCNPPTTWIPSGQGWTPPGMTGTPNINTGSHQPSTPMTPTGHPPMVQGVPPIVPQPVQQGVQIQPDNSSLLCRPQVPLQQGKQQGPAQSEKQTTDDTAAPQPLPEQSAVIQTSLTEMEQRLQEAMTKKLETITESLKASMSNIQDSTPATPMQGPTASPRTSASVPLGPTSIKSRKEETSRSARTTSTRRRSYSSRSRGNARSVRSTTRTHTRSSRSRSPIERHQSKTHRPRLPHRREQGSHSQHSYSSPGHRDRAGHHEHSGHREGKDDSGNRTSQRKLSHPIYQRSNAMKQGTTFTEGWRQVHSDPQTTVLARSHEEKGYVDIRNQDDRSNQPITLRSRSRTKAQPRSYRSQHTSQGFHLYPRDRHQPPKTRYASSQREPSQSEAESAQVTIPPPWNNLTGIDPLKKENHLNLVKKI